MIYPIGKMIQFFQRIISIIKKKKRWRLGNTVKEWKQLKRNLNMDQVPDDLKKIIINFVRHTMLLMVR